VQGDHRGEGAAKRSQLKAHTFPKPGGSEQPKPLLQVGELEQWPIPTARTQLSVIIARLGWRSGATRWLHASDLGGLTKVWVDK
jgi:hypothetical protein